MKNEFLDRIAKNDESVTSFSIFGNIYDIQMLSKLALAMKTNNRIQQIAMSKITIDEQMAHEIVKIIGYANTLQSLNLALLEFLPNTAEIFFSALKSCASLKQLVIFFTRINDAAAREIGESLANCSALLKLVLHNCYISTTGMIAIAKGLKVNFSLVELNIINNCIDNDGMRAIADFVGNHTSLEQLVLDRCQINSVGASTLAKALQSNSTLLKLCIGSNRIGTDGIRFIINALGKNNTLLQLSVNNNSINSQGAIDLSEFIRNNATLDVIYYNGNMIDEYGKCLLNEALRVNTKLQIFKFTADRDTLKVTDLLIKRNEYLKKYPQFPMLIKTIFLLEGMFEIEGLYEKLAFAPLSLRTTCIMYMLSHGWSAIDNNLHCGSRITQQLPDEIITLFTQLNLLIEDLTEKLELDSIPAFGVTHEV